MSLLVIATYAKVFVLGVVSFLFISRSISSIARLLLAWYLFFLLLRLHNLITLFLKLLHILYNLPDAILCNFGVVCLLMLQFLMKCFPASFISSFFDNKLVCG